MKHSKMLNANEIHVFFYYYRPWQSYSRGIQSWSYSALRMPYFWILRFYNRQYSFQVSTYQRFNYLHIFYNSENLTLLFNYTFEDWRSKWILLHVKMQPWSFQMTFCWNRSMSQQFFSQCARYRWFFQLNQSTKVIHICHLFLLHSFKKFNVSYLFENIMCSIRRYRHISNASIDVSSVELMVQLSQP